MGRILRIYVIREVALPSLLALLTITFILLMGRVYDLINLLLQPGVRLWQVARVLASFMPAMLIFAIPMSILIGTLVGVGRMTLDREILAVRSNGVNLFNIFYPAIFVAGLLSLGLMGLAGGFIPRLLLDGMSGISELQFAVINSLEPGRFHDKLGGADSDYALYFRDRDPQTHEMKGVTVKLEDEVRNVSNKNDKDNKKAEQKPKNGKGVKAGEATSRNTELTIVFAESGAIESLIEDSGSAGDQRVATELTLKNGAVHRLTPEPDNRRYVVLRFDKMEKRIFRSAVISKRHKTMTNAELRQMIAENRPLADSGNKAAGEVKTAKGGKPEKKRKDERLEQRGIARRELVERHSISLASLVFTLIGIPLAIWIKPSGKSWGILLAISLMLMYYILLKMGLTMVEVEKPLGVPMAYAPNLLFVVLGAGLWWQSVRS